MGIKDYKTYCDFIDGTGPLFLSNMIASRLRPGIIYPSGERLSAPLPSERPCSYCEATLRPSWDKCRNCGAAR